MAEPSSQVRIGSLVRKRTISYCSYVSVASARSSLVECWRTCASSLTCAICWSRVLRLPLLRTLPQLLDIRIGGTDIPLQLSISNFWHTQYGRLMRQLRLWSVDYSRFPGLDLPIGGTV